VATFEPGAPVQTDSPEIEVTVNPRRPLPIGKHVFSLVAVDNSGNRSKPARLTVEVFEEDPTPERPTPFRPFTRPRPPR
jgi:hypothetical protein